ncbi:MAG: beta strand repeat-containing protein [Fimbriimonadales bacterium]
MAGCGGGGTAAPVFNTSSKIVVGYVYVSTNITPQGSPATIVSNTTVAPNGYAAPTAGSLTLHVDNGAITRAAADMIFDLSLGNAIIARVTSLSSGTPALSYSATGIQLNGTAKADIPTQSVAMTGSNDVTLTLSYGAPSYTAGSPAAIKVLTMDPNGTGFFGAPADTMPSIIPSTNAADRYGLAVIVTDANGVVNNTIVPTVSDPNSNATENAVAESLTTITVSGGGVEGVAVPITVTAGGLSVTFSTTYTYGPPAGFVAAFAPVGPTTLTWPTAGPVAAQAYTATVTNGRGVPVPSLTVSFTRADTATASGGAAAADPYPAPAAGNAISGASAATDAAGHASVTFNTPTSAAGNAAFNTLNIKGTNTLQIRNVNATGVVFGTTAVVINRPLGSITIAGPTQVNISSVSPASGAGAFLVTSAADVDGTTVAAPAVVWNKVNAAVGNVGNTGDNAPATDATTGTSFSANVLTTGAVAGQLTVTATGGVTSNALNVKVIGLAQRVFLTPDTSITGTMTAAALSWYNAAGVNTNLPGFSVTVLDSGGNDIIALGGATVTARSITNTSGTTFIGGNGTVGLPFVIQSGTVDGTFNVNISGTGLSSTPFSLQRTVGVNIAP